MIEHEEIIRDLFRAVEERDSTRLLELYHPDVEFLWPPSLPRYGGTYRAGDVPAMQVAFASAWRPLQTTPEARRLDPEILGSRGDEVVVHYHQRGVHDGLTCDAEVIGRYQIRDGKMARLQMFYFDPDEVATFLRRATGSTA